MLIKDPYLGSEIKPRSFSTVQPLKAEQLGYKQEVTKIPYLSQPYQKPELKNEKSSIRSYERQMRSLSQAYRNQQQALRKISSLHFVNKQYNEAMKQRNFQLNTKLTDLNYEKCFLAKKHQEEVLKSTYDKDLILRKYEQQNEEIIRLKRSNAELMQQKGRLQSQIDHLMFLMQKDSQQGSLEIKEQLLRMQNMERTLRNIIDTKDAEIVQLRHRLKVYEDENRRLNDMNKTLTITQQQLVRQQQKLQNLSNISHIDSNIKSHNKQNIDLNRRDDYLISELNQQKETNKQLMSEITMMKKRLFEIDEKQEQAKETKEKRQFKFANNQDDKKESVQQKLDRHNELRQKINVKVYDLYCKSIKQGERQKRNSLLLFIENYKKSSLKKQTLISIEEYMTLRESLKQLYKTQVNPEMKMKLQTELPMRLNSRSHTKDSDWVLGTMQLAKNQKVSAEKKSDSDESSNNMLFLFRLLTIEYRTKNPLEDNDFLIDADVQNQLLHSIVKALQQVSESN